MSKKRNTTTNMKPDNHAKFCERCYKHHGGCTYYGFKQIKKVKICNI